MKRVMIYKRFERFWHWSQALLVILLAVTGFNLHFTQYSFMAYEQADALHRLLGIIFAILIAFAIFWHFTTGEWKQYIPTGKFLREMFQYYISGVFKNAPHPVKKTHVSKLNPLQRLAYLGLKIILIPVLVISGFAYYFWNDIPQLQNIGLGTIATIHVLAAFLLIAFMIAHVYLATMGETFFSHYKAMITGYEDVEEETAEQAN